MANEKTVSISMSLSRGGNSIATGSLSQTYDVSVSQMTQQTFTCTTTAAQPTFSAVTWASGTDMIVKNMGTSATAGDDLVTISVDSGGTYVISKLAQGRTVVLTGLTACPYFDAVGGAASVPLFAWVNNT